MYREHQEVNRFVDRTLVLWGGGGDWDDDMAETPPKNN